MVEDLRGTSEDSGTYAGIFASSYFLGGFLGSFPWGSIADKFGKKPCIMAGLLTNMVTIVWLGYAKSYWPAVFARFLAGLLNCNLALVKSYLGLVTDKSNQTESMSYLAWAWGLGMMLAPVLGGALCKPAESDSPAVLWLAPPGSAFVEHPYLLPCLFVAVLCGAGLVASALVLEQDSENKRPPGYKMVAVAAAPGEEEDASEKQSMLAGGDDADDAAAAANDDGGGGGGGGGGEGEHLAAVAAPVAVMTYWTLLKSRGSREACWSYSLAATTMIVFSEMVPLYAKSSPAIGGLGMGTAEIGLILGMAGVAAFVYQPLIYPPTVRRLGLVRTFRLGSVAGVIFVAIFPLSSRPRRTALGLHCCRDGRPSHAHRQLLCGA
eukprot:SAG22_NODE_318_length_12494_cov_18.507705_10_plen_379_part_00